MAEKTEGDKPVPQRVRGAILAAAKKGRKPAGGVPTPGAEMDAAMMRGVSGIMAERMIEQNAPGVVPGQ